MGNNIIKQFDKEQKELVNNKIKEIEALHQKETDESMEVVWANGSVLLRKQLPFGLFITIERHRYYCYKKVFTKKLDNNNKIYYLESTKKVYIKNPYKK